MAPFFAHPLDVYSWYVVGQNLLSDRSAFLNYLVPYDYSFFLFAFPGYLAYIFLSPYFPNFLIQMSSLNPELNPGAHFGITVVPGLLFDLLVKIPLIISDTLVAYFLYKIVQKKFNDKRLAISACLLWFLNPLTIWVSSGWGMFDTLPTLCSVLALYLLNTRKFAMSAFFLVVGIFLKYYAVVLFIPLAILAWSIGGSKGLRRLVISFVFTSIVFSVPLTRQVISGFTGLLLGSPFIAGSYHYSGLSIWTPLTLFVPNVNQGLLSILLLLPFMTAFYIWIFVRRSNSPSYDVFIFTIPLLFLLTMYSATEANFFVWVMPFVAIFAAFNEKTKRLYWAISLVVLFSSVTVSLLPYYLLPVSPWIGADLVKALTYFSPYKVESGTGVINSGITLGKIFLSSLSLVTCLLLTILGLRLTKTKKIGQGYFEAST